jgi:hypothetical protein
MWVTSSPWTPLAFLWVPFRKRLSALVGSVVLHLLGSVFSAAMSLRARSAKIVYSLPASLSVGVT